MKVVLDKRRLMSYYYNWRNQGLSFSRIWNAILKPDTLIGTRNSIVAIFYRGAGIGTYWHTHDARQTGFIARSPQMQPTPDQLMLHITRGTVNSPFVSLTRSYGIALNYANFFGTEHLHTNRRNRHVKISDAAY